MLLVLDTSTAATVAAFCDEQGAVLWEAPVPAQGRHGDHVLPQLEAGLSALGKTPADVSLMAVGIGPGSFTGLRIGLATAQGWALSLGTPAYGVLSPLAIAAPLLRTSADAVVVIGDAFKGEVALSVFVAGLDGAPGVRFAPQSMKPERVVEALHALGLEGPLTVVGDGLRRYGEQLGLDALPQAIVADPAADGPSARALAQAALRARDAGDPGEAMALQPHYVRDADAKLPDKALKL